MAPSFCLLGDAHLSSSDNYVMPPYASGCIRMSLSWLACCNFNLSSYAAVIPLLTCDAIIVLPNKQPPSTKLQTSIIREREVSK